MKKKLVLFKIIVKKLGKMKQKVLHLCNDMKKSIIKSSNIILSKMKSGQGLLFRAINSRKVLAFGLIVFMTTMVNAQTTYTTAASGAWNTASNWVSNSRPPTNLPSGDSIIIRHAMVYNVNQNVLGVMVVNSGASVIGTGQDLTIGSGAINRGKLINRGRVSVDNLEVKPGGGCTVTRVLPAIHNYSSIITAGDFQIGNNCGAGSFYNYIGGKATVGGQVHLDNYLYNEDTMLITGNLKNHGGYVEGGGFIRTPYLEIDNNSGRPGTFDYINICGPSGIAPTIDVNGTTYPNLIFMYANASSSNVVIDRDSTRICGTNQQGTALPVALISFEAYATNGSVIVLKWKTASELNNQGW